MPVPGPDPLPTRRSLLLRLKDWNDEASWEEFNDLYKQLIRNFVLKLGVAQDDAEDVAQDTLCSVAKALRKGLFDPKQGSFKNWLFCVTRNRVYDHFRRSPPWREAHRAAPADTARTATVERIPDPSSPSPEAMWEEEWRNHVMALALKYLKASEKPTYYQIYHLYVIKGKPAEKVAKLFGVRSSYVHVIKCRLDEKLEKAVRRARRVLEASPKRNSSK